MLLLFLALVGLGMIIVESLRAPPEGPPTVGADGGNVLELRLGRPPPASTPASAASSRTAGKPARPAGADPSPPPQQPATQPAGQAAAPAASGDFYVVQPGDTLSSIAQQQLGSAQLADELAKLNGITDPNKVKAGMRLRLR
jgi:nucleoid-associated protein YgaU